MTLGYMNLVSRQHQDICIYMTKTHQKHFGFNGLLAFWWLAVQTVKFKDEPLQVWILNQNF